jgi:hypothetical protein
VHSAGVEWQVHHFTVLSDSEAADIENNSQGKERAVLQLKAGAGTLLILSDGRADRLSAEMLSCPLATH